MLKRFKRKENTQEEYKFIYILTEGKKTEPIYFQSKKHDIEKETRRKNIKIKIKGTGYNTLSLIDFALDYVEKENIDLKFDDCWVVFDKDDFDKNFDNAVNKAKTNNLKVAYSNESFELWFLLHFNFMNSAINRDDYNHKLTKILKKLTNNKKYKYSKTTDIYSLIQDKELRAIKNARILLKEYKDGISYSKKNPSTTVYLLVESLNQLKKVNKKTKISGRSKP